MAESAVEFLIRYLGSLLVEEGKLLKGVRGEACRIRDELESMQSFLKDADAREHSDESIKTWVRQVREAAHDAEDILDEFILRIGHHRDGRGVFGILRRVAHSIKQLKARHQIGTQIKDIRTRLSDISKRKDDYNLNPNRTEQGSNQTNLGEGACELRLDALFTEESELVGIDDPRSLLISWCLEGARSLSTISVVGMGGLGKTTLVKKVYDNEQVKKHFETHAWITVSQIFKREDLLRNMIKEFYETKQEQAPFGVDGMTDVQLIKELRGYLQEKRFVLVLDDVWDIGAWNSLSIVLPARQHGSRIILTTRKGDVAISSCLGPSDHIHNLQPLDTEQAWSLFCRRAFPLNEENRCPLELKQIAQSFVKKCQGLPLAIVTLGSLLAIKEQTYPMWELMHRSLGSQLESDGQLISMTRILLLGFNDLPYYLKSCFLYLSLFPEGYSIGRMQIIQLWMAEGFIQRKEGMKPEEVGESYLNALITRSLIQVKQQEIKGQVLYFGIHDLVREIIISKSREENLFLSSTEENGVLSGRIRRLSFCNKGETVPMCERSLRLRSLFIFKEADQLPASSISLFARFHLLRVVIVENVPMESFPEYLTSLLHLRCLSLQNTKIKHLPRSIGKLINLETMNFLGTFICELPAEILKLRHLRHLLVGHRENPKYSTFHYVHGTKVLRGVGNLRFLQSLECIQAENGIACELGKLTQLRTLRVNKLRREDGCDFCNSIEKIGHLQTLEVISMDEDEEIDLHSLSYPPPTLQHLHLSGYLKQLPQWIASLENLVYLNLHWSKLKDDPLKALRSLRNLLGLRLRNAYDGEELCVEGGEYPKLRELCLLELRGLKKVTLVKGAMPNLEHLAIAQCEVLVQAPHWLQNLLSLKQLLLMDMPMAFLRCLKSGGEESADFIQHIPSIQCIDTKADSLASSAILEGGSTQ